MNAEEIGGCQQRRAAQIFNQASIIAVLVPPLILLWIAASIFVYASLIRHPNPRVADYLRPAGYRFYGLVGSLAVLLNFTELIRHWFPNVQAMWLFIWVMSMLVVIPYGVRDILRAGREAWPVLRWVED
ncbi:hypothetical protein MTYP_00427 [Methylophilaceae bacterium]|nr:hypothetical protein MTYP_00427 [Methylophilaceae bacterium]